MSSLLFSLPEFYNSYKTWVSKNPTSVGDWENTAKWVSYFIAGRINDSQIISELIYCLSNLLVMLNDIIIKKSTHIYSNAPADKVKLWLTVVEYSEVFLEISAKKLWGNIGKWVVVTSIQIFKCVSRLILIYHYKENMIEHPPVAALNRQNMKTETNSSSVSTTTCGQFENISFTLKRSGRVVRKVDSAPPIGTSTAYTRRAQQAGRAYNASNKPLPKVFLFSALWNDLLGFFSLMVTVYSILRSMSMVLSQHLWSAIGSLPFRIRTWKPLQPPLNYNCENNQSIEEGLLGRKLIAETIYIAKPMVHLASMACFGSRAWKPYFIALVMDLSSLQLYKSCKRNHLSTLTPQQRLQLSKRTLLLVLYLIRSPVYEKYSKDKINGLLLALSKYLPLAGLICNPLRQYIPYWQSMYFYTWST